MDEVAGIILVVLISAVAILAMPISLIVQYVRVRDLRRRVDGLEEQLDNLRGALAHRASAETTAAAPQEKVSAPVDVAAHAESPAPSTPAAIGLPPRPVIVETPPARVPVDAVPVIAAAPAAEPEPAGAGAGIGEPRSLEERIGTRWLLYIGVVAIVVGAAYFEKLAIDYGWIGETARVVQGVVVGFALIAAGLQFAKRGQALYGQVLAGGGGAILYLSIYAAFNFYSLISQPTAFVLMIATTVLIAWLADRQRSQGLALFAVGGGFATPFMLPGTTDAQIALFTYDAILIAGTAVLSRRRDWPFLHLVSYVFTLVTVAGWADRFYASEKYLRTELYITLYCGMFVYIAVQCRRAATDAGKVVWLLLCTAPLAYYFASLGILADHGTALLVWLVALALVGGLATSLTGALAGLVIWIAVACPLLIWCTTGTAATMYREGLVALAAVYLIALLAEFESTVFRDEPREPGGADVAWIHLNPLVMFAGAYLLISPNSLLDAGYLAAAFAAWNITIAAALWKRRASLAVHVLAVGFTLSAIAIALIFRGAAVTAGWAVEGALVVMIAIRQRLAWLRIAGVLLFAIAIAQTIGLLTTPTEASHVIFFNARAACAALVVGLCYLLAWFDWTHDDTPSRAAGMGAALLTAQFVTLALLTSEIDAYWAIHNGHLQRELMLSVTWGLYATALVVIGLARDYAPIRYFAIVVLAITIAKVFFVDMAELDRIYRVGSVIALGVLLLVTSYLYSRSRQTH
jgi:uncharacterized membrane protein